mmetsp:Transcript_40676/g.67550  ORF Transcript_40676/g.67550 Transcript_40676/m.67550 type:complete len:134 (+) Transcript_40676:38-439(+)
MRGDGRGLAMIGGFLRVGESAEDGVAREVLEETGLTVVSKEQFCLFSDPTRDPRRHTAALVFVARASPNATPRAADDAKSIRIFSIRDLQRQQPSFAFDHGRIVQEYLDVFHGAKRRWRPLHSHGKQAACPVR